LFEVLLLQTKGTATFGGSLLSMGSLLLGFSRKAKKKYIAFREPLLSEGLLLLEFYGVLSKGVFY